MCAQPHRQPIELRKRAVYGHGTLASSATSATHPPARAPNPPSNNDPTTSPMTAFARRATAAARGARVRSSRACIRVLSSPATTLQSRSPARAAFGFNIRPVGARAAFVHPNAPLPSRPVPPGPSHAACLRHRPTPRATRTLRATRTPHGTPPFASGFARALARRVPASQADPARHPHPARHPSPPLASGSARALACSVSAPPAPCTAPLLLRPVSPGPSHAVCLRHRPTPRATRTPRTTRTPRATRAALPTQPKPPPPPRRRDQTQETAKRRERGKGPPVARGRERRGDGEEDRVLCSPRPTPVDAKAYKPTESDLESESEEDSDSGKPRRRKKKKGETGGLLTGLPTVGYGGKRRKRKSMGGKEDSLATLAEEDDGEIVEKIGETLDMQRAGSVQAPPLIIRPAPRPGHHESQPPLISDDSFNTHQRGPSLPRRVPKNPKPKRSARSLGALTSRAVNVVLRLILFALSESLRALGRALGTVFDATIRKPAKLLVSTNFTLFIQIASVALIDTCSTPACAQSTSGTSSRPRPPAPVYTPPDVPAASIAELGARLQALENALGKLSLEAAHERARLDAHPDVSTKLESLRKELSRQTEIGRPNALKRARSGVRSGTGGVRRSWIGWRRLGRRRPEAERVKALEERLGGVEGGLKEALEVVRKPVVLVNDKSHVPAWWTKLSTSSAKPLSIKGNNGEDVTVLIGVLVDEVVLRTQEDGLARADLALHSGGARVIPSLTSPTLDGPPPAWSSRGPTRSPHRLRGARRPPTRLHTPPRHLRRHVQALRRAPKECSISLSLAQLQDDDAEESYLPRRAPQKCEVRPHCVIRV
ncbi:unnamed protein product [Peniophora sp. CBMAI 1063]|nr:unnamed protein product [Peniophora sp. CBMAI 1063]